MRGALVVPPERHARGINAERRVPARYGHPLLRRHRSVDAWHVSSRFPFLLERQPVPHVKQRLLVHGLVLENGEHGLRLIEQRMPGAVEFLAFENVEHATIRLLGKFANDIAARPDVPRGWAWCVCFTWIDAAGEQVLELLVDAGAAERLFHQRVEAERRQVPFVEHDRMPKRDRLAVVGIIREQIEEHPRSLAVAVIPGDERFSIHTG